MSNDTKREIGVEALRACLDECAEILHSHRGDPSTAAWSVLGKLGRKIDKGDLAVSAGFVLIETPEGTSFLQPLTPGLPAMEVAMSCLIQAYAIVRDPATLLEMLSRVVRAGAAKGELATLPLDATAH